MRQEGESLAVGGAYLVLLAPLVLVEPDHWKPPRTLVACPFLDTLANAALAPPDHSTLPGLARSVRL